MKEDEETGSTPDFVSGLRKAPTFFLTSSELATQKRIEREAAAKEKEAELTESKADKKGAMDAGP